MEEKGSNLWGCYCEKKENEYQYGIGGFGERCECECGRYGSFNQRFGMEREEETNFFGVNVDTATNSSTFSTIS